MSQKKFPKVIMVWETTGNRFPEERGFSVVRHDSDLPTKNIIVAT